MAHRLGALVVPTANARLASMAAERANAATFQKYPQDSPISQSGLGGL
jgi:hypothetical protein